MAKETYLCPGKQKRISLTSAITTSLHRSHQPRRADRTHHLERTTTPPQVNIGFNPIVPNWSPLSKHLNGHRAFRTTEVLRSGFPKNWNLFLDSGCLQIPDVGFKVRQLVEQIRLSLKMFRTIRRCKQLNVNLATFQNLFEKLCTMGPSHQKT
jgi:hypothetical protein